MSLCGLLFTRSPIAAFVAGLSPDSVGLNTRRRPEGAGAAVVPAEAETGGGAGGADAGAAGGWIGASDATAGGAVGRVAAGGAVGKVAAGAPGGVDAAVPGEAEAEAEAEADAAAEAEAGVAAAVDGPPVVAGGRGLVVDAVATAVAGGLDCTGELSGGVGARGRAAVLAGPDGTVRSTRGVGTGGGGGPEACGNASSARRSMVTWACATSGNSRMPARSRIMRRRVR